MSKLQYILFFLIFGIFGTVQTGFACEKHHKKSNDTEQVQKQAVAHHFINNGECEGECDCNGACGHSDCHCAPSVSSILNSTAPQIIIPQTIISTNFYWSYNMPHVGDVLITIWQPPKIS